MDGDKKISIKILEVYYWKVYFDRGASCSWIWKFPEKWVNNKMESLNLVAN